MSLKPSSSESPNSVSSNPDLTLSAYQYQLPTERIASFPLSKRDAARMLVMDKHTGDLTHKHVTDLLSYLKAGDCLVVNNTTVLHSRFKGHRDGYTGIVEVLLLRPMEAEGNNGDNDKAVWTCLMKPTRKLAIGTLIKLSHSPAYFEVVSLTPGTQGQVKVHLNGAAPTVSQLMLTIGEVPIPPYLNRPMVEQDKTTYQTVYHTDGPLQGSQAAPTAGLHFTPDLLASIKAMGVVIAPVTLSVSTGTFKSVTSNDITQHQMDAEQYHISPETAEIVRDTKANGGRVFAVGTTSCKTLETVAACNNGQIVSQTGWSQLFIYPGFTFNVVDALLTNFHLPQTTLMMLVSAFSSRAAILHAYNTAVTQQYRFFSYGDCMLIQ
jgi:S-adenosylmethionine:tRNA ribosyltransferase-isomerase